MSNHIKGIQTVTVVPTPEGYYLDLWPNEQYPQLERWRFGSVDQLSQFSMETRRIALLATHYEELTIEAKDVLQGDLFKSLNGGTVEQITEVEWEDILHDGVRRSADPHSVEVLQFAFYGSTALIQIKSNSLVNVLRRIQ